MHPALECRRQKGYGINFVSIRCRTADPCYRLMYFLISRFLLPVNGEKTEVLLVWFARFFRLVVQLEQVDVHAPGSQRGSVLTGLDHPSSEPS